MKKALLLISCLLLSAACYGQTSTATLITAPYFPTQGNCRVKNEVIVCEDSQFDKQALVHKAYNSTGLLYAQDENGSMKMLCTVTAFERNLNRYKLVTAAHCTSEDSKEHERVDIRNESFFVTYDEVGEKKFNRAKVLSAGFQSRGDDFSVLEIISDTEIETMPVGDETKLEAGDEVLNIASPLGLGKQTFQGYVSMTKLDRPLIEEEINWQGAMLLQINAGPGSSGSTVIGKKQQAIVGFVVGSVGGGGSPNIIAIPVSRFVKFQKEVSEGKYRWFDSKKSLPDSTE